MRIFLFTTAFAPSIGGIERLTELLAHEFVALGHEVRLATLTPGPENEWPFPVLRRVSMRCFIDLLRWCDVHVQANMSLRHLHPLALGKPFFITHQNAYARDQDRPNLRERLKVALVRTSSSIACSEYIARELECDYIIHNPYDNDVFFDYGRGHTRSEDIIFVGRLVREKGCDTLISALSILGSDGVYPRCCVVGDGPERKALEQLAAANGVGEQVRFVGVKRGNEIAQELNAHRVIVVPSRYREPFGIVALEGLACGCLPIVSANGGLRDAVGSHGLTFPNGDPHGLARAIRLALNDQDLTTRILDGREEHLAKHSKHAIARKYIDLFEAISRRN